jgi:hypothetical protein
MEATTASTRAPRPGPGRIAAAALCSLALALAAGEARADEFQDHVDHAGTLAQGERFKDALTELEAAYTLRQSPRLLYMMAKMQQRLGDSSAALGSYERFLAAETDPDPRLRTDAQEQVVKLRHLLGKDPLPAPRSFPGPEPGPEPPRVVHYESKTNAGVMAGGAVLFGAAYLGAVVTGSIFLQPNSGNCYSDPPYSSCPGGNLQVASGMLLIPVLGPFIAAFAYRDPTWSLNWALVDGVAQVGGVAMMAYAATHPKKVPVFSEALTFLPYGGKGTGGLQAIGRF